MQCDRFALTLYQLCSYPAQHFPAQCAQSRHCHAIQEHSNMLEWHSALSLPPSQDIIDEAQRQIWQRLGVLGAYGIQFLGQVRLLYGTSGELWRLLHWVSKYGALFRSAVHAVLELHTQWHPRPLTRRVLRARACHAAAKPTAATAVCRRCGGCTARTLR